MAGSPIFLGLDLGTSGLKALALALEFRPKVLGRGRASYPIRFPQEGFAEQDPRDWLRALRQAVGQALEGLDAHRVLALGLSGQMHGVVLSGAKGEPLYPAVIWPDARSAPLLQEIEARVPKREWARFGGPPTAGFAGPTLYWFARHRPELLRGARWALQPKDWLRMWLSGEAWAEPSDASATFLFEVEEEAWSEATARALGIPPGLLPPLKASHEVVGHLLPRAARSLGLPPGLPVVAGAADQAAAALANGVVRQGQTQVMLGSGGQILLALEVPRPDPAHRTHLFRHALPRRWYRLAAVLNVGTALGWIRKVFNLPMERIWELAQAAPPGAQGLRFRPYLLGERTPHMDPGLAGAWEGLRPYHGRPELLRAALEGIAYSLKEALEALGLEPQGPLRVAGGLGNPFWLNLLADVLGKPLEPALEPEASAWGAGLLAAMGLGTLREADLEEAGIPGGTPVEPGPASAFYAEAFAAWRLG